jgi:hypothetical protein
MNSRKSMRCFPMAALWLLVILAVSATALAQKVQVTYDKTLDFSKFKTYAWEPHGAVAHPMLAADVVGAIDDEMKAKGFRLDTTSPDIVIQIYGSIDQESTLYSNDPLYAASGGIPPFEPSFSGPALTGLYGNTTVTIHKGQMVVDLIQFSAKKLVWRGMATDNLSANHPDKLLEQVNGAIAKMFKEYPAAKS